MQDSWVSYASSFFLTGNLVVVSYSYVVNSLTKQRYPMLFLLDKPEDLINQIKKAGMKVNNILVDFFTELLKLKFTLALTAVFYCL